MPSPRSSRRPAETDRGGRPARAPRRKSPVGIWIAAGVSVVMLIVAIVLFNRVEWDGKSLEDVGKEKPVERRKSSKLAALVNKADPYKERVGELVGTLMKWNVDDFPLYIERRAIFDFTMQRDKSKKRYRDLTGPERDAYYKELMRHPAFDGRWKLAKIGDWTIKNSGLPGYIDHDWLMIPRRFPATGDEDAVRLLIGRDKNDRPKVRGFDYKVLKGEPKDEPVAVADDLVVPDAVKKQAGFKSLDKGLEGAALPVAAKAGKVDGGGAVLAGISKVALVDGTGSGTVRDVETHIAKLVDPASTRGARDALKELTIIGKPAVPVLLNKMVGKDLKSQTDVFYCHQIIQALRDISGKRFGFEPQVGEEMLTAGAAADQEIALRRWFGWWKVNAKTFKQTLSPQLQKEIKRRESRKRRLGG